jgi:cell division septal protein FtsQ
MDIEDFLFFCPQLNQINKQLEQLRKMVVNRCRFILYFPICFVIALIFYVTVPSHTCVSESKSEY